MKNLLVTGVLVTGVLLSVANSESNDSNGKCMAFTSDASASVDITAPNSLNIRDKSQVESLLRREIAKLETDCAGLKSLPQINEVLVTAKIWPSDSQDPDARLRNRYVASYTIATRRASRSEPLIPTRKEFTFATQYFPKSKPESIVEKFLAGPNNNWTAKTTSESNLTHVSPPVAVAKISPVDPPAKISPVTAAKSASADPTLSSDTIAKPTPAAAVDTKGSGTDVLIVLGIIIVGLMGAWYIVIKPIFRVLGFVGRMLGSVGGAAVAGAVVGAAVAHNAEDPANTAILLATPPPSERGGTTFARGRNGNTIGTVHQVGDLVYYRTMRDQVVATKRITTNARGEVTGFEFRDGHGNFMTRG